MYILGINAYHPDSSACVIKDGKLLTAVEEERFKRIKHWSGFPTEAIRNCLKETGINFKDIDYIGISRNPYVYLHRKILFALKKRPRISFVNSRLENMTRIRRIRKIFCSKFSISPSELKAKIYNIEHHRAHMASNFFVSAFDRAAILSLDAMGDFLSMMSGYGKANHIKIIDRVLFPHSLGFLYTAVTQFLGFLKFGDEYKVMGLAAYGQPRYLKNFNKILILKNGKFFLNLEYFCYCSEMTWDEQEPVIEKLYSKKWIEEFGNPRDPSEEITQKHKDIAASLQTTLEEAYFYILTSLYEKTRVENLCLAGGVALNCVANGKIFKHTPFKEVFIQPAANDAGTSIGAAYYIYHQILNKPRGFVMEHAYWGPEFKDEEIEADLRQYNLNFKKYSNEELINTIASEIANGKIVGWFQGKMEWGPRALGNRSILVDPRRGQMKNKLNAVIKHRESFRPFAPSILEEDIEEYFENSHPSPFMLFTYKVKEDKKKLIPAVVHIDGTGRVQTVNKKANPLYWKLINEFKNITGVPILLNTSFNENEPIVCKPKETIDCFLRTNMDILVMGNYLVKK